MKKPTPPGRAFETALTEQFKLYAARGICRVEKVEPPTVMRCIGPGRYKPVHLENPFLDFIGTWTAERGRTLIIEAKSTSEPRLACPADNGIKAEQLVAMERWQDAGAFVALLWEYRTPDSADVRIVTPAIARAAKAVHARASIAWDQAIRIPNGLPHQLYTIDFMTFFKQLALAGH